MKKLLVAVMTLAAGVSLFAAGPNFADKNNDGVCDTYVSRGNKTSYEAGVTGAGQHRNTEGRVVEEQTSGHYRFRENAPGNGMNRK